MAKLNWDRLPVPRNDNNGGGEEYEPTNDTVIALLELQKKVGGKYWHRGGHHRLYLEDDIYVVARTNTLYLRGSSIPSQLVRIVNELNMKLVRKEYS